MKKAIFLVLMTSVIHQGHAQQQDSAIIHYIEKYKDIALKEKSRTGIPVAITLAQAILESEHGTSILAKIANNHFGIKYHGWKGKFVFHDDDKPHERFRAYDNVSQSFVDHSNFLLSKKWYKPLFHIDPTDYKAWAYGLKNAGYATDPKYPEKLIKNIEKFELFKYDDGSLVNQ